MLGNILGMRVVDDMENYLDLPLSVGKNKTNAFRFIIDRFSNRIKGWSKRLLSFGGMEVFSKAILQSLSTYMFFLFSIYLGLLSR